MLWVKWMRRAMSPEWQDRARGVARNCGIPPFTTLQLSHMPLGTRRALHSYHGSRLPGELGYLMMQSPLSWHARVPTTSFRSA